MRYLSVKFKFAGVVLLVLYSDLILGANFIEFATVVYEQHNFRHNLTSDMTVTLTLGVET